MNNADEMFKELGYKRIICDLCKQDGRMYLNIEKGISVSFCDGRVEFLNNGEVCDMTYSETLAAAVTVQEMQEED